MEDKAVVAEDLLGAARHISRNNLGIAAEKCCDAA